MGLLEDRRARKRAEEQIGATAEGGLANARNLGLDRLGLSVGERIGAGVNAFQQAQGGAGTAQIGANLALNPQAPGQQAGAQRQGITDAQQLATLQASMLANEQAAFDAQEQGLDRYGSRLNRGDFTELVGAAVQGQRTLDIVQFIGDVVGQTTPAQLALPELAETRGRLQASKFPMYTAVQRLMETKKSTLREGERAAIDDFLGSPDEFWAGMLSFDAATITKFNTIGEWTARELQSQRVALDGKTTALLDQAAQPNPSFYNWQLPEGAKVRPSRIPGADELEIGAGSPFSPGFLQQLGGSFRGAAESAAEGIFGPNIIDREQ